MASELRVYKIVPTSGVPSGGGGGVIQVTQGSRTSRSQTTSTNYVASGLSGTITPKVNTSKVLVTVTTTANWVSGAATAAFIIRRKVGGSYVANSPLGNTGHGGVNNPDGATMAAYTNDGSGSNNQMPMTVELWMAANGSSGCGIGGLGDQEGYNVYNQIIMMEVSA